MVMHDEDGGTREILESIVITPLPNAPFTATLETEWVKYLYTGGTITLVNRRRLARDKTGRFYQERWWLVPKNGKMESRMTAVQIADPVRHLRYGCMMQNPEHVCTQQYYAPPYTTTIQFSGPPTGPLPNDTGYANHEELGKQNLVGVETVGTRDTTIYNPGVFGNDAEVKVEREYWYSPQLGINLLSKRSDPRFGSQTFTVTELTLGEPDPQLFDLPKGFRLAEARPRASNR